MCASYLLEEEWNVGFVREELAASVSHVPKLGEEVSKELAEDSSSAWVKSERLFIASLFRFSNNRRLQPPFLSDRIPLDFDLNHSLDLLTALIFSPRQSLGSFRSYRVSFPPCHTGNIEIFLSYSCLQ